MAEQYIIGSNAQFNDSVEILKDLTLYGVVENSTDFAVKIQGDEKLRISADGVKIIGGLQDEDGHVGAAGSLLSSTGTALDWIAASSVSVVDKIIEGNTKAEVVDTGSDGHFLVETEGVERLRINSTGAVGIGTTNPFNVPLDVRGQLTGVAIFSSLANGTQGADVDISHIKSGITNNDKVGQISFSGGALGNATTYAQIRAIATDISDEKGDIAFYTRNGNNITGSLIDDERLRITSGGILVKGHTESAGQIDTQLNQKNQFHGNDRRGGIRIADFSDSNFSSSLQFVKSRAGTVGVNTILQDGDHMGQIYWGGANGTNFQPGAFLIAKTEGTVGVNTMPTALSFGTNEGNNLVERLRIDPDGMLICVGTNAQDMIRVSTGNTTGDTFGNIRGDNKSGIRIRGGGSYGGGMIELAGGLRDTDPAVIKFHTGTDVTNNNDEHMRITSTGKVLINTTSTIISESVLEVQGGSSHGDSNYIQTWKGDSDNVTLRNMAAGDYELVNNALGNLVAVYDGTGGARLEYGNNGNYIGMNNNVASSNRVYSSTTTGGSNVRVTSDGKLRRLDSTRRSKDNIREYVGVGVSAIKQMVPKLWEDHTGEGTKLGFIAEEIHDLGLTNAVTYEPYIGGSEIGIGVTYGDSYGNGSTPVTKTGEALDDEVLVVGGLDEMSLIAELVIAVKQLTARIETLESGG